MPNYIDPASLKDVDLILKRIGENDYAVRAADRAAGRIMLKPVSGGGETWFWTLTGPYIPAELQPGYGEAATLEEAKAQFRAKFDRWRAWAETLGHPVVLHGGLNRRDP